MPPCHQYSYTKFLNMFLKAVSVGVVQNRPLHTASYLAETPAGNREGNKLTLPHQQPPSPHPGRADVPASTAARGEREGSVALDHPPASAPCSSKVS